MKKFKFFSSLTTILVGSSLLSPLLTSCTKTYKLSIKELKQEVIKTFYNLTSITHTSNVRTNNEYNNLRNIKNYYKSIVQSYNLTWVEQPDDLSHQYEGNAYFDIPATNGYQNNPAIILQAHMDIVYVNKDPHTNKYNYKINLVNTFDSQGNNIIKSDGMTNIGADNGIGVATILALAKYQDKFNHGLIRCILTTDEEQGCNGAQYVPSSWFKYQNKKIKYLLNLDWETLDQICVASSGVYRPIYSCNFNSDQITNLSSNSNYTTYKFKSCGFKGGHNLNASIHANALLPLLGCIKDISYDYSDYCISYMITPDTWSEQTTNIPKSAEICISFNTDGDDITNEINGDLQVLRNMIVNNYEDENKDAICSVEKVSNPTKALTKQVSSNIFNMLINLPNGKIVYDKFNPIEDISGNLSPLYLDLNIDQPQFSVMSMLRAYNDKTISEYNTDMDKLYTDYLSTYPNAKITTQASYPAWVGNDNRLIKKVQDGYKDIKLKPESVFVNSGLENSMFVDKVKNIATIGPTIVNSHEVEETLYVDTLDPYLEVVLYVLEHI